MLPSSGCGTDAGTGAFTLAAAGLLDGRTVTTHWMHAAELARRWPAAGDRADGPASFPGS